MLPSRRVAVVVGVLSPHYTPLFPSHFHCSFPQAISNLQTTSPHTIAHHKTPHHSTTITKNQRPPPIAFAFQSTSIHCIPSDRSPHHRAILNQTPIHRTTPHLIPPLSNSFHHIVIHRMPPTTSHRLHLNGKTHCFLPFRRFKAMGSTSHDNFVS